MKILAIHSDYLNFEPKKKAIKDAEEVDKKEVKVKDCLVVFSAVEKQDEKNPEEVLKKYIDEIENIAKQVKTKNIVLYPYAHLSSDLANPNVAVKILKDAEKGLSKYKVTRAPFGWYKAFEIKCKGHPLSELSREISVEKTGKKKQAVERYDVKQLLKQISQSRLDTSKLKENDHRILGKQMDLFSFNDVAPGMVFWHDKGLTIYNELVKFWREEHKKAGYQEISTPTVLDKKLWQISGHWEKYMENIFLTEYEGREFAVKPMNCPGGLLVYNTNPKSYKDLSLRVGELGIVHRHELSGVLAGLFRVIKFTQDDAHIYCTEEQLEDEIIKILMLVDKFYKIFKLPYNIELSTRPKKRIGNDKLWDKAENILNSVLKKKKIKFKLNKGDGAFYGPKIDFHIKDSLGRTWQCGTIQLDFAMPERFELEYTDKDSKKKRPVMLHRTILGSLERFLGVLLEHLNGNLPLWLSPIQVRVLTLTDRNIKAAEKVVEKLKQAGIRVDFDYKDETMGKKVREAQLQKINYIVTIGDKEEKNKTLAVRSRSGEVKFNVKVDNFIKNLLKEIGSKEIK